MEPAINQIGAQRREAVQGSLRVEKLTLYYGPVRALSEIDFAAPRGEIVALLGSNGAGKSTFLRALIGLEQSSSGSISFSGTRIEALPIEHRVRSGIATVLEGRGMLSRMTVMENLRMGAFTQPAKNCEADLHKVFATFPILNERRTQLAGTLSGGEQQMLAFGRAMMSRPKLILMDEPSMGLAPVIVEKVFDAIQDINRSGTTIILVEQNARMALSVADRFYVLSNGKIALSGSVIEGKLFTSDQDGFVPISEEELEAAFLEAHEKADTGVANDFDA